MANKMSYDAALDSAYNRARETIPEEAHAYVFDNDHVRPLYWAGRAACIEASDPQIANNLSILTACSAFVDAMTKFLFARAAVHAASGQFFRRLSARRVEHSMAMETANAGRRLHFAIRDALTASVGCDTRDPAAVAKTILSDLGHDTSQR